MKKIFILSLWCWLSLQLQAREGYIFQQISQYPIESFENLDVFVPKSKTNYPEVNRLLKRYDVMALNDEVLQQIRSGSMNLLRVPIQINGQTKQLLLIRNRQIGNDIQYTYQVQARERIPFEYSGGDFFHGIIEGESHSLVSLSFFEEEIAGMICMPDGNYTLGRTILLDTKCKEMILYSDMALNDPYPSSCGTELLPERIRPESMMSNVPVETITVNCVKFYLECDQKVYTDFGSNLTNATNYATGLFNNVSTLYLNDSVSTAIAQINIWTVADPYINDNTTLDALNTFSAEMDANGFNGDLAHLLSRRSLGGGIAWLDVLCDIDYYRCAVSASLSMTITPLPTYSWNSEVITHEMGHNIASRHTHACAWNGNNTRIDNCGGNAGYTEGSCNSNPPNPVKGTIMSYCHLVGGVGIDLALGFGPQPGALIRSKVNAAGCLTNCPTCPGNVSITGNYSTALTESSSAITSTGQTTIVSTATVKLDADPNSGYILLSAANTSSFVLSAPSTTSAYFIAQAYDGCNLGSPSRPASESGQDELISHAQSDWKVYPNPSQGMVYIEHPIEQESDLNIQLLSMDGKVIYQEMVSNYQGHHALQLNKLPLGVYLLRLQSENETVNIPIRLQN
jgi:hypothetical protein